jgi:hypothetical protein
VRVLRRRFNLVRADDTLPGRRLVVDAAADLALIVATAALLSSIPTIMSGSSIALDLALALPVIATLLAGMAAVVAIRQWIGHVELATSRLRYTAVVVVAFLFASSSSERNLFVWPF